MDAQTRHELKQNELAQAISRLNENLGERGRYITIAIAAIVVLIIAWRIWSWNSARSTAQSWENLMSVQVSDTAESAAALDTLRSLVDSTSGDVQRWAKLRLAAGLLHQANFTPSQRDVYLNEAIQLGESLTSAPHPEMAAAAQFTLATAYESQGKLDEARKTYEAIAANEAYAGIPYHTIARERAESVGKLALDIEFEPGLAPAKAPTSQPSWFEEGPLTLPTTQPGGGASGADGAAATQPASAPDETGAGGDRGPGEEGGGPGAPPAEALRELSTQP